MLAVVLYGLAVNLAVPLQQRYGALPVLLRAQLAALVLLLPFGLWGLGGSTFAGRRCWPWCRWGCSGRGSPSSS